MIEGAKKGGGGRAPIEESDSLRSAQVAQVLDLISEGEIQGLVNGLRSVYLDGVPLENADGTKNFQSVQFAIVPGTQGQAALPGIDAVQNEIAVGQPVPKATPVVRTITNPAVDTVRVTIAVPQLSAQDSSTGDLRGSSFEYAIEVQSAGGGYVERVRETVTGKTTSTYRRAKKIQLSGAAPWDVRVKRISDDSGSATVVNAFSWDSYTEIQSLKLRYPNSAVAALQVGAQQFQRVPTRAYDVLGLRVRVPVNYTPLSRVYSGVWDGTFKIAWTDNPAWIFYDLATHPRYGLGKFVADAQLDKWALYAIGQYCDQMVPDGRGGSEPRFTCHLYLQTREQALTVLQHLAAVFRALTFWAGGQLHVVQDAPSDAVVQYTPANVIGGRFSYQGGSERQRHSVFIAYYNDLSQLGKRVPEVYAPDDLTARYGIRELELSPIGVWSRGQAQRLARWAAYSEEAENESVSFQVGADGALVLPGQVFLITDPNEAEVRYGGRVRSATTTQVTLDAPVTLASGEVYTLSVTLPDPADDRRFIRQQRPVTTGAGTVQTLTVLPAFTPAPAAQSIWLLQSSLLAATTWRCVGVSEVELSDRYEINAIAHDPTKYALIELGVKTEARPISRLRPDALPPTNLTLAETVYMDGAMPKSRVTVSWLPANKGMRFQLSWRWASGAWQSRPEMTEQSTDISGLEPGELVVAVRAVNALGSVSPPVQATLVLQGKVSLPATPTGLAAVVGRGAWTVSVNEPPDADWSAFELRRDGTDWNSATRVFKGRATSGLMPFLAAGGHVLRARHWAGSRLSNEATLGLQVNAPTAPNVTAVNASVGSIEFRFGDCTATQPLKQVLFRVGTPSMQWDDAADAGAAGADQRSHTVVFSTAGTQRVFLRGQDAGGNLGSITISDVAPTVLDTAGVLALIGANISRSQLTEALGKQIDSIYASRVSNADFEQGAGGWTGSGATLTPAAGAGSVGGDTLLVNGAGSVVWWGTPIAVDTARTYKVRVRVRQKLNPTAGSSYFYAGVIGYDKDGVTLSNVLGASFPYAAAAGVILTVAGGWQVFEGLISGTQAIPSAGIDYHKFFAATAYAVPMVICNYPDGNGQVELDVLDLIDVAEAQAAAVAVQQETITRASETGHLAGYYGLRVQLMAGGVPAIGGFGIMGTSGPSEGPRFDVAFRADRIYYLPPQGVSDTAFYPYVYYTTAQTIDGVVIQPGLYLKRAFIEYVKADQIDTRNLAVKDGSGTVIFAAGTKLNTPYIEFGAVSANVAVFSNFAAQLYDFTGIPAAVTLAEGVYQATGGWVRCTVTGWLRVGRTGAVYIRALLNLWDQPSGGALELQGTSMAILPTLPAAAVWGWHAEMPVSLVFLRRPSAGTYFPALKVELEAYNASGARVGGVGSYHGGLQLTIQEIKV